MTRKIQHKKQSPKNPAREAGREAVFLDRLFENAEEGIVITDPGGKILRTNRHFLELFGYREEEVLGSLVDDLIAPPENRYNAKEVTKKVALGENLSFEAVRFGKKGNPIDVSVLASPILIENRLFLLGHGRIRLDLFLHLFQVPFQNEGGSLENLFQ